jgi:ABC-type protease/lipase transport system fused ATPase/permease subunit
VAVSITGNELAMVSAGVAAVAVVASVVNNRSTNKSSLRATEASNASALRIAQEERASKRQDELEALKRAVYARYLAALTTAVHVRQTPSSLSDEMAREAYSRAFKICQEMAITAGTSVVSPSYGALFAVTQWKVSDRDSQIAFESKMQDLRLAMRADLNGTTADESQAEDGALTEP